EGRIYLADEGPRPVVAVGLDFPDVRRSLPTTIFEVPRSETVVCLDSAGHVWAQLAGEKHPFLSVFREGQWVDMNPPDTQPLDDDLTYLQPLKHGCIVAQRRPEQEAFFFDGEKWTRF